MTNYQKLKLAILMIISVLLLFLLYSNLSIGRYVIREKTLMILDTKTGTIYIPESKKYLELKDYEKIQKSQTKK